MRMDHSGINILTRNEDVTHQECTSSLGMHILTGNAHSLYRVVSEQDQPGRDPCSYAHLHHKVVNEVYKSYCQIPIQPFWIDHP